MMSKRQEEKQRQARVNQLVRSIEQAVEQACQEYDDLGITTEKDFRGLATLFAVRIRTDRTGGITNRQVYEPINKKQKEGD